MSAVSFLSCVAVWIYFRNFALPVMTYATFTMGSYSEQLDSYYLLQYILGSFLVGLCCLHLYWTTLFFKMIVSFKSTGSTENQINKIKNDDDNKQVHLKEI